MTDDAVHHKGNALQRRSVLQNLSNSLIISWVYLSPHQKDPPTWDDTSAEANRASQQISNDLIVIYFVWRAQFPNTLDLSSSKVCLSCPDTREAFTEVVLKHDNARLKRLNALQTNSPLLYRGVDVYFSNRFTHLLVAFKPQGSKCKTKAQTAKRVCRVQPNISGEDKYSVIFSEW